MRGPGPGVREPRRSRRFGRGRQGKNMPSRSMPFHARAWSGAALALAFSLLSAEAHAQAGPFASLSGTWSGGGTISLASGANERIRCRAAYNFDLAGSVVSQGGAITGTWSESSRGVNGTVSGRASGNQIQAYAQGSGFSAGLSLATHGNRQSVVIRPTGADVTSVSIVLARR